MEGEDLVIRNEEIEKELDAFVAELKEEERRNAISNTMPDIMYVADISEEMDCEEEEERFYGASEKRDDLVGLGDSTLVGIYRLVGVQRLEAFQVVTVLETDLVADEQKTLPIDLGEGPVTVRGSQSDFCEVSIGSGLFEVEDD